MPTTTKNKKKEMTLLQAIVRVVELSKDSKLSKELMRKAKTEIQLLANSYGITERQAVLFCVARHDSRPQSAGHPHTGHKV